MKQRQKWIVNILGCIFFLSLTNIPSAYADFAGLLNSLKSAIPNQNQANSRNTSTGSNNAGSGQSFSYHDACKNVPFLLGTEDATNFKPEEAVINTEFKIGDLEALQDLFYQSLSKSNHAGKAFISAQFWKSGFETAKIRTYYDSFLSYPEPQILNEIIKLSRDSSDKQIKRDALMALVFIHLQAPELSVNRNRPVELYRQVVESGDNWPNEVFKARLYAFGEGGAFGAGNNIPNPGAALGYLVSAGNRANEIRQSMGREEWDANNNQEQHDLTALQVLKAYPNLPEAQNWKAVVQNAAQMIQAQDNYARMFLKSKQANLIIEARNLNDDASKINEQIIQISKNANRSQGQLASQMSIENANSDGKSVFVFTDPKAETERLKAFSNIQSFSAEQKKMLTESQAKRLASQDLVYEVSFKLMTDSFANMRDMVKAAAPAKVMRLTQQMLYQNCIISDKWERAMRAKDIPRTDDNVAAQIAGSSSKKYKD